IDDNAAPREEGVPVAVHQHALHHRLREARPLSAQTTHARQPQTSCAAKAVAGQRLHLFMQETVPA
uniref:Uncharacterized protein n=1 Tax=Apteryx owenii TaxID=8824 RepID=A0A8B9QJ81_APTOW